MKLVPAIIIGGVVGLAVGWISYKATGGLGDFIVWINPRYYSNMFFGKGESLFWILGGMIVGAAVTFLRPSNSK